jgi:hypothetical protein
MSIISTLYKNLSRFEDSFEDDKLPAQDLISPEEKNTSEYCMKVAQKGFSNLMGGSNVLPADDYDFIQVLRNYGSGLQDEDFYVNRFRSIIPTTDNEQSIDNYGVDMDLKSRRKDKRTGMDHISTKILSPMRNIKDAIHGMFDDYEEDVFVDAIDADSGAEAEMAMAEAWYEAKFEPVLKEMEQRYQIPLTKETFIPQDITPEELEMYRESGGFKTKWAEGMEQLIKYTEQSSEWSDDIKRKFLDDMFDLNFIAARCTFDHETNEERWQYIDPANFTIQYSTDRSFKDAEYAGYFTLEKVSRLVQMGFDFEELCNLSRKFEGLFRNPRYSSWSGSDFGLIFSKYYYDFSVPVFHYYWIETDVYKHIEVIGEAGKRRVVDIDFHKAVKPVSEQSRKKGIQKNPFETRIKNVYQCSWFPGSKMIYDYGRCYNQPKERQKEASLPVKAWKGLSSNPEVIFGSKTESLVPLLDSLQMAWLKHQDAVAKSHDGGYAINLRLLENLEMGGKNIDPIEAYKMWLQTNVFPYRDYPLGESYKGGAVIPMTQVAGNLGELTDQTINLLEIYKREIYDISGISPAVLGATTDSGTTATESNIRLGGSQNTLKPLLKGIFYVKERLALYTTGRVNLLIRNVEESRKSYERVVGKDITELLVKAERNGVEYGMFMEARASETEIMDLMRAAEQALSVGRDGAAQIDLSQFMFIFEQMRAGGNFKKLRRDLAFMIKRKLKEDQAITQQNITLQSQQQAQIEQQKAQAAQQTVALETQSQMAIDDNKAKNEILVAKETSNFKMKEDLSNRILDNYGEAGITNKQA